MKLRIVASTFGSGKVYYRIERAVKLFGITVGWKLYCNIPFRLLSDACKECGISEYSILNENVIAVIDNGE